MEAKNSGESSFGNKPRELCPNITTSDDLMHRLGTLSVDILNKDKVIAELWGNIDELLKEKAQFETVQAEHDFLKKALEKAESDKAVARELESKKRIDLKSKLQKEILQKAEEIQHLKKTLKSIESEAVINQEELRRELMIAKEALSKPKQVVRQKRVKKKARPVNKARA